MIHNNGSAGPREDAKSSGSRKVGILGYDDVQALDLIGPADAFAIADEHLRASGRGGYKVLVLGLTRRAFTAESGVQIKPHTTLEMAPRLDTLLISGGRGLRAPGMSANLVPWLQAHTSSIRRVASICTGIYALAQTGLLDGRCVTTHWRFARDVARRFPRLRVDANAIFIKSGKFYSAAGITAGIDLALALIEEDHGPALALAVARELVVYLKRSGGQEQYSEPLQFQVQASDRLADLASWISGHLHQDLSVEALAARVYLSPRHFTRLFKDTFGINPGEFVENLRLAEARRRLAISHSTIKGVADSIGFASADSFRRAFQRRFGIAPNAYRGRFGRAVVSRG